MVRRIVRDYYSTTREFSANARLFLIATFLTWVGLSVNQVVFNLYLISAGYAEDLVGGVTSMMGIGMAATALPAGWFADRFGRRACLVAGATIVALALAARSLWIEPAVLFGATLALGAGQALGTIAASPFMSENSSPTERTYLFSMQFVVVLLGGILGNTMGGELPGQFARHAGGLAATPLDAYRLTLLAGAFASLAALLPLASVREAAQAAHVDAPRVRVRDHRPLLAKLVMNYLLVGMGAGLIMPFFNLYFAHRFGADASQIGRYFSVAQVITLVATLLGPLIAQRAGKLVTVTWLQLASLPFLVTLGFEKTLWVAVLAFWGRSALMQMSSPLLNAYAMERVPAALRARAVGLDNAAWYVGWSVSSATAGWVIARFGYDYPYYFTALLYGVATVTFYFNFRRSEPGSRSS
jgi:MFS family permease